MPIYEYHCEECREPFELFVRLVSNPPTAVCPQCGSEHVEKGVSAVSTLGSSSSGFSSSDASCAPSG
ncbi:MAG: zinc ribbon domain-containing protein [Chloroflexi bacterium]|nr:zinc ribbon domain-containing protein [Chloroflexota bacterium]